MFKKKTTNLHIQYIAVVLGIAGIGVAFVCVCVSKTHHFENTQNLCVRNSIEYSQYFEPTTKCKQRIH